MDFAQQLVSLSRRGMRPCTLACALLQLPSAAAVDGQSFKASDDEADRRRPGMHVEW